MEILDLAGAPVQEGDVIAASFRVGNIAVLRVGKIRGFGERDNRLTVQVHWFKDSLHEGEIDVNGAIDASLKRFIKLDPASL